MTFEPEQLGQSRDELAAMLKALRKRVGLSGDRLAARCSMSQSKISRIENGRVRPSLVDIEHIMRALGASPELAAEVFALARIANTEWQEARDLRRKGLDKKQLELAGLESSSSEFRSFLLSMITGLLSTPEYIRASLAHIPGKHEKTVSMKLARQKVFQDRSKRFTFVLTEQAVRFPLLPRAAMADQIDHLVGITRLPNVRLGVIPMDAHMPGCPLNTFTIYDQRIATVEVSTGVLVFRDPQDVQSYIDEFSGYEACALFGAQARQLLGKWAAIARRDL
ncbi:helix-turn-helix transcriptional regulator [Streptomyces sp. B1866]|uniref:helix-turn-helix domain-containing protein n=1 Tax=Streptomyces sp. B1866 TaxID=3075431 RepID=UPI00288D9EC7|nr:helix-turn-helix transcriptional regulator [Streptomyces sp. B1866]MDT3398722.1 helix-turn-helix transcriptional regulator [Streptomyces sp. B1866]